MRVACLQLTTRCDPQVNLAEMTAPIEAAVADGAQLVALPETCNFMEKRRTAMQARAVIEADDVVVAGLSALAARHQIWLLAGSLVLRGDIETADEETASQYVNRSLLFAPDGHIAARYDKIHMFDVTLANGETHRESSSYQAGDKTALADLADLGSARLGLTICYDVRFPALYRQLALAGADIIAVPSAFTSPTGAAHWHVLLRARAIETGCFIIAPAQCGTHENGRETYGHSLIINPWGEVLDDAGADKRMAWAMLDMAEVKRARQQIPALTHGRSFMNVAGEGRGDD